MVWVAQTSPSEEEEGDVDEREKEAEGRRSPVGQVTPGCMEWCCGKKGREELRLEGLELDPFTTGRWGALGKAGPGDRQDPYTDPSLPLPPVRKELQAEATVGGSPEAPGSNMVKASTW